MRLYEFFFFVCHSNSNTHANNNKYLILKIFKPPNRGAASRHLLALPTRCICQRFFILACLCAIVSVVAHVVDTHVVVSHNSFGNLNTCCSSVYVISQLRRSFVPRDPCSYSCAPPHRLLAAFAIQFVGVSLRYPTFSRLFLRSLSFNNNFSLPALVSAWLDFSHAARIRAAINADFLRQRVMRSTRSTCSTRRCNCR